MSQFKRPGATAGLRHLALNVVDLDANVDFYMRLLGMTLEWQPDADNYYLTSGNDNLALHRAKANRADSNGQALDHQGFIIDKAADAYHWFDCLTHAKVEMLTQVKYHRDGARSRYCNDSDGNGVALIYHPPISDGEDV